MSGAAQPAMSRSLKRTLPPLGRSRPAISLSRVDLPAPFGPIRATISPAATVKSAPLHDLVGRALAAAQIRDLSRLMPRPSCAPP